MAGPVSNPLVESGKPLFFKVADKDAFGFKAPEIRLGEAVRLCVRLLSVVQKEALVVSARTALDMSEQTCFLHAFCKADLKTKVSIESYKSPGNDYSSLKAFTTCSSDFDINAISPGG